MLPRPRLSIFKHLLAALAVSLSSCGKGEKSYFPLDEGWNWEYRVTSDTKAGHIEVYTYFVTNLAPVDLGGHRVVPRLSADGGMTFYGETPEGVIWFGEKTPGKEFASAPQRRTVIANFPNSGWESRERTRLLRTVAHGNRVVNIPVTIGYGIKSEHDSVSVPAGHFEDCLKVSGEGRARFDGGSVFGMVDILIETTDWYAPGVGLVKSVRREKASKNLFTYGNYAMELESFSRGS